jgi:hypothetical protein
VRRALVWVFRRVVGVYFREIEATGNVPHPDTSARLFVSNHVNALVDAILVLTAAPCPISPVAKSTLWNIPVVRWLLDIAEAVPLVRRRDDPGKAVGSNEEVFDRVASWLAGGGNILIFPEGTSHNQPHLIEVRTGAARMLVRAYRREQADAQTEPRVGFQAVALEFDARDVFRSRCLLVYGPVRSVAELAAEHAGDDALVVAITAQIREDLSELLVEGATWAERLLIARVAEMLAHDAGDHTLAGWSSIGRQVEAARRTLREVDEALVPRIAQAVDRYYALLAREGVADEQLAQGGGLPRAEIPTRLVLLALALPLATLAVLLYWLPYQVPRLAALRAAKDPDEVSTIKVAAGLLVYPLWVAALTTAAFLLVPPLVASVFTLVVLVAPFVALAFRDLSRPLRRSFRAATRARSLSELRASRTEALRLVEEARSAIGA